MNEHTLRATALALVGGDRGLLAMDESTGTCNKRFASAGIPQTEEARRAYREMIVTTPDLGSCISGAILYDETIRQKTTDGTLFVKVLTDAGIIPGIKVEVLPGLTCATRASVDEVADATVRCLLRVVPAAVPGIAFLSGGQSSTLASARLNAMHVRFKTPTSALPWALTFSFGRALQRRALRIWGGDDARRVPAQQALLHRARCNRAALRGEYDATMERNGQPRAEPVAR